MIRENKLHQLESAMQAASAEGMVTMDTSLLDLYNRGIISEDTLLIHCTNYEYVSRQINK
jgi:twitching motility protein PilT